MDKKWENIYKLTIVVASQTTQVLVGIYLATHYFDLKKREVYKILAKNLKRSVHQYKHRSRSQNVQKKFCERLLR